MKYDKKTIIWSHYCWIAYILLNKCSIAVARFNCYIHYHLLPVHYCFRNSFSLIQLPLFFFPYGFATMLNDCIHMQEQLSGIFNYYGFTTMLNDCIHMQEQLSGLFNYYGFTTMLNDCIHMQEQLSVV